MRGHSVLTSTVADATNTQARDDWGTPADLFAALDAEFCFDLDAAADSLNALCMYYFDAQDDALLRPWNLNRAGNVVHSVWLNPPYSKVRKFMRKARYEAEHSHVNVVCLVPARTDTQWWRESVLGAAEVRFITGRLRFTGAANTAPFPSAIVVFRAGGRWPLCVSWIDRPGSP